MPGPIISGLASLIVPGLGQILNGKFLRGGILLVIFLLLGFISTVGALFFLMPLVFVLMIASAYDAYKIVKGASTW